MAAQIAIELVPSRAAATLDYSHPQGRRERVENDNRMVDWSIEECFKAAKDGRGFSMESPQRAYLWLFPGPWK